MNDLFAKYIGTVPGWGLLGMFVLFWWQGLPKLIDAWEKRAGGIEARLQESMKATLERYDAQLREADRHHQICVEEQEVLRRRIGEQDLIIATQNGTIATQSKIIVEMAEQVKGLQVSNLQQQTELAKRIKGAPA